jgi:hypothetical protein
MIALDSLAATGEKIEVFTYDTKSYSEPLGSLIDDKKLDNLDLMIGTVRDQDYKQLADFAYLKQIPFVSATFPNDGGITMNPSLAIVSSTLKTHCEAIYNYVLQEHGTDRIFFFKKTGVQEGKVAEYFKEFNEKDGKPLLKMQVINIDSFVSPNYLKKKLDTTHRTVIIAGSLDEDFARNMAGTCNSLGSAYKITLIGMPNWSGFKELYNKDIFNDVSILYTTPFSYNTKNSFDSLLTEEYDRLYKIKPSDMAYKGFENTYFFTSLLLKYPKNLFSHLNEKGFNVFNEFNFKPVMVKKTNTLTDYYENKHVYILKIYNGAVTKEW